MVTVNCLTRVKKKALYLSVKVFSTKVLRRRDRHFTYSSEPRASSETQGHLVGSIICLWWKFTVRSRRARAFETSFQISWSQFKKGHYIHLCHSYLDALNTTNLSSLKERRTQLCCKYIQEMTQNDHPINFVKPRTAISGHSYNLLASDNRNIVYADRSCCRNQRSGSFISFLYFISFIRWLLIYSPLIQLILQCGK